MAPYIIPRLVRGRLYFQISDALFPSVALAASASSAAVAHRLDLLEVRP